MARLFAALALSALLSAGCMHGPSGRVDVRMEGARFVPEVLTVPVNATVTWKNASTLAHTVTSDNESGPLDSGNLGAGATYEWTFTEPGIWAYHCIPHSAPHGNGTYEGMVGRIVVLAP